MASKNNRHKIGESFIELQSVDSTNNYAFDMIQAKLAAHGLAIFAHEQTKGKGQHGKAWVSEKSENIMLSVVLDASFLQLHQQFYLSAAMALAGYDFMKKYLHKHIFIKWPNDLYWNDKKACGILIETKIGKPSLGIHRAVAGFGINVNQTKFPAALKNPVSLKLITGLHYKPVDLSKRLCVFIEKRFTQLKKGKYKLLLKQYNKHLYKLNEEVKLKQKNIVFTRTIKGVDEMGNLLVENAAKDSYAWGEVEFYIA